MDPIQAAEFTKWLATLGVGGALGAFMFMFYRKDSLSDKTRLAEVSKENADRLRDLVSRWDSQASILVQIVKESTQSNTQLVASSTQLVVAVHALQTAVQSLQMQLDKLKT